MSEFENLEVWVSRFRRWTSELCSLRIIDSTFLFGMNSKFFVSFHLQGLHIVASIMSDFRCWGHTAWKDRLSFCFLWYSHSPQIFEVPYFVIVIGVHFAPNHSHPVDYWTFQFGSWIRLIGSLMNLRKWAFKQWIHNRSCGKHWNKWNRFAAIKVFTTRLARAENSEPTILGRRERFGTMSRGVTEHFLSRWCGFFILRSSLQPLSNQVADHPEHLPWSTHCTAPTTRGRHRTTQSWCVAKRSRCVSVEGGGVGEARPPSQLVRTAPHAAVRQYHQ
jgi:hypothetical protein